MAVGWEKTCLWCWLLEEDFSLPVVLGQGTRALRGVIPTGEFPSENWLLQGCWGFVGHPYGAGQAAGLLACILGCYPWLGEKTKKVGRKKRNKKQLAQIQKKNLTGSFRPALRPGLMYLGVFSISATALSGASGRLVLGGLCQESLGN